MARLAIALSGGVDSTCAAWLLKQAGHELLGLTLDLGPHSLTTCQAATRSARELGIEHQVLDVRQEFENLVVDYSLASYSQGLTPNPCVRCNATVKIPLLAEAAASNGCQGLATGHYARLLRQNNRVALAQAHDAGKSQAYFLARLQPDWLAFLHFPLGKMDKTQVRQLAGRLGLSAAIGKESQDCCFLPSGGFAELGQIQARPGIIEDSSGKQLGRHQGLHRFTVGQRRGLGISAAYPLYVLAIRPEDAVVVVGGQSELMREQVTGYDYLAHIPPDPDKPINVRLRYTRQAVACRAMRLDGNLVKVTLAQPYRGVAPGQLMVFSQDDCIIGSAWIGGSAGYE